MRTGAISSSNTNIIALQPLAQATTGTSGLINFTSIPQTYRDLWLIGTCSFSTTLAGSPESYPSLCFNNDTGSNYARIKNSLTNSNGTQTSATGADFAMPGVNASFTPWVRSSQFAYLITDYTNTSKIKMAELFLSRFSIQWGWAPEPMLYSWNNTAAITQLNIKTGHSGGSPAGTFLSNSLFTLYGLDRK